MKDFIHRITFQLRSLENVGDTNLIDLKGLNDDIQIILKTTSSHRQGESHISFVENIGDDNLIVLIKNGFESVPLNHSVDELSEHDGTTCSRLQNGRR